MQTKQHADISAYNIPAENTLKLAERPNSYWITLTSEAGRVEGKLHLPVEKTEKLFVFQPGFPGRGSADLEQIHLDKLLASGLAVFTPRHNGSLLTGQHSDRYIFCKERQELAANENQKAIGADVVPLDQWLVEPLVGMQVLTPAFAESVIWGHSFGGLATMYSAAKYFATKPKHNIKRLVSMAGATGRIRSEDSKIMQMWSKHLDSEWVKERVSIGDTAANLKHLKDGYTSIHDEASHIPPDVDIVFLHPWGESADSIDELIGVNEPLELLLSLGRGTLIVDMTQKADAAKEQLAHDMVDLSTEAMQQIIASDFKAPKQIMTLDKHGLR